jgi:hypothetical protein
MNEHKIILTEEAGLPEGGYYADFSDAKIDNAVSEPEFKEENVGQKAAEEALRAIQDRSFAGRNIHLGKMINCQFCGLRHRENERKCEQKVVTELKPPKGKDQLTVKQILGAARFNKKKIKPRKAK